MSATQTDVVDYIKNLKLSEVKALISILRRSWVSRLPPP